MTSCKVTWLTTARRAIRAAICTSRAAHCTIPAVVCMLPAVVCAILGACATVPDADSPKEYLDNDTAATVSVVGRPLVFAHDRPERAANMRDYVTMAAAAVNRGGKTDYVIITYFWTTLDFHGQDGSGVNYSGARPGQNGGSDMRQLVISADDRRIVLSPEGHSPRDAGIGAPVDAPPTRSAVLNVYHTDLATLRYLSTARHLAILRSPAEPAFSYEVWEDRRPALNALVRSLSEAH